MSSASKGRYQSRLFNFFHKQYQRFGDGMGRSLRQLQVATSWYAVIFFKSIYLLLQKVVDSSRTQLRAAAESYLQLQASVSQEATDSTIIRICENLETTTNEKIRGIASQLSSKNLVLVTSENEIIDILTPSQQQVLENKIISEVANYWRCWRLSQVKRKTNLLSRVKDLFLEKIYRKLLEATTTKALPQRNAVVKREYKYLQINPEKLIYLDTAIAKLETNALVPISRAKIAVRQGSGKLIKIVRTKLDIFLYGDRQVNVNRKQLVADSDLETQKSKIQTLIEAALNYFYGEPTDQKIPQTPSKNYLSSTQSKSFQLTREESKDDWLSLRDLIGTQFPQLDRGNPASNNLDINTKQFNPSTQINNFDHKIFGRFQIPNWRTLQLREKAGLPNPQKSVPPTIQQTDIKQTRKDFHLKGIRTYFDLKGTVKDARTTIHKLTSTQTTSSKIFQKITITPASGLQNQNNPEIAQNQTHQSTQIEAKPEWIETKAAIVGYQKHPLEQILAWIDGTMWKIEQVFIKVANTLHQLWRK